jgi:starch-binding outer membrane protein, SusD/RagB family
MPTRYTISIWLSACLLVMGSVSCDKDFLDRNPLNSVSSQVFWTSEADVQTALAGVYSRLQQNFLGYERVYLDGLSDNAYLDPGNGNQGGMYNMTIGSITASQGGAMANMYSTPYRAITSVNYFLDNVDRAPIAEARKTVMKAEVRFIRALAYADLVQAFGGVIIYRNFPATIESAKIAKSSPEEVYAFIEEDLDFAIANLPDEKYNGHAVKGSAQALKARVLATQQKWAPAAALLQQLMASGKFALANNYAALFTRAGQANAAVNTEILFSTQYLSPNNVHRINPGSAGMDIELGWWSLLQPYQDLVDEYEMRDGLMPAESPLFDPTAPYANRDPRLDLTLKVPGEVWRNGAGLAWTGSYTSQTNYLMEKYVDLSRAPFTAATAQNSDQDYIHLRYAEVLLLFAEAQNEVGGPEPAVYAALNQVRARPGINMPPVDEARYNTKEKLRDFIRHERRVELALEGQRYNDLKRWNIAHVKLPTLTSPAGAPLKFETNNYVLPFQQTELDSNPSLVQNTGY